MPGGKPLVPFIGQLQLFGDFCGVKDLHVMMEVLKRKQPCIQKLKWSGHTAITLEDIVCVFPRKHEARNQERDRETGKSNKDKGNTNNAASQKRHCDDPLNALDDEEGRCNDPLLDDEEEAGKDKPPCKKKPKKKRKKKKKKKKEKIKK